MPSKNLCKSQFIIEKKITRKIILSTSNKKYLHEIKLFNVSDKNITVTIRILQVNDNSIQLRCNIRSTSNEIAFSVKLKVHEEILL